MGLDDATAEVMDTDNVNMALQAVGQAARQGIRGIRDHRRRILRALGKGIPTTATIRNRAHRTCRTTEAFAPLADFREPEGIRS